MALNHLLYRHQLALMRASNGTTVGIRTRQRGLAEGYAVRIRAMRDDLGGAAVDSLRVS